MKKYIMIIWPSIKLIAAQIAAFFLQPILNRRNIWIFGEKKREARDNGYHFFKYIVKEHPEIDSYYVIKKGMPDEAKVKIIGKVVHFDSFKHCVLYYSASVRACSEVHGVRPYEQFSRLNNLRIYRRKGQHHVNLKHGISKDMRDAFVLRKDSFDLMICCVKREYDFIKAKFDYPEKNITLSGFCRLDYLHEPHKKDKLILVMPTFRQWLRTSSSAKQIASQKEMDAFLSSDYYKHYENLLTNTVFINIAKKYGYKVLFYLHYTIQPYTPAFRHCTNEVVTIADREHFDVQDLLIRSSVLITDYSSVFFDYAYMKKPVVYWQFDEEMYRSKHYQKGFFDYRDDGFGPVVKEASEVCFELENIMKNNCKAKEQYRNRMDNFFIPYDNKNCERTYQAILNLDK